MLASDLLTHIGNHEDVPFLRIPLFDVNMRLFHSAPHYRRLIGQICHDLKWLALSQFEDYTRPYGISGANMGVPFNIVGYVVGRNESRPRCWIMLNPKIVDSSPETHVALSNCGSIRLPKPIKVRRCDRVLVHYFNENGTAMSGWFGRSEHGDTIQHEVDHNLGRLITDLYEGEET